MDKCCISCRHFRDAQYSKVYITPRCAQRGDDDAMWMRANLCGLSGTLYEAKPILQPQPPARLLPA